MNGMIKTRRKHPKLVAIDVVQNEGDSIYRYTRRETPTPIACSFYHHTDPRLERRLETR
jgi:hypothetical protein